jgi:site-specific recombinase XerD
MEDVLEVYHRPHDPDRPVVCVDETSKQLIAETRAGKCRRERMLPLPQEVGAALAEYLQHGRPHHRERRVFLTLTNPAGQAYSASARAPRGR